MEATLFLWAIAVLLMLVGVCGLIFPAMPGAPLLFLGMVVAAWAEDFAYVGTGGLVALGFLALLIYSADILAGMFGAKKFGASNRALLGAAIGAFVGIFFGLFGILAGPFFGALIGELSNRRDLYASGMSGLGATLGLLLGAIAKLTLAFMMLGLFAWLRLG
jgi:uncharacterized protein YqgC (DUF456 family)